MAREMGEEIHATYCCGMEATWGPEHLTTVPEDYAQHVILGVSTTGLVSHSLCSVLIPVGPVSHGLSLLVSGPPSPAAGYLPGHRDSFEMLV